MGALSFHFILRHRQNIMSRNLLLILSSILMVVQSNKYILSDEPVQHHHAKGYCQSKYGTTLASIHSEADNAETQALCEQEALYCLIGLFHYIQPTDDGHHHFDEHWHWIDGTRHDYYAWAEGFPSYYHTHFEPEDDCVYLYAEDGAWRDGKCAAMGTVHVICNKYNPTTTTVPTQIPTVTPTVSPIATLIVHSTETIMHGMNTMNTTENGEGQRNDDGKGSVHNMDVGAVIILVLVIVVILLVIGGCIYCHYKKKREQLRINEHHLVLENDPEL